MMCGVCGGEIVNPARSWPSAGGPGTPDIYRNGHKINYAHLGCWRLFREYGDPARSAKWRVIDGGNR